VKEQVRAFSIEARRRQQEDARWKEDIHDLSSLTSGLTQFPYARAARALASCEAAAARKPR